MFDKEIRSLRKERKQKIIEVFQQLKNAPDDYNQRNLLMEKKAATEKIYFEEITNRLIKERDRLLKQYDKEKSQRIFALLSNADRLAKEFEAEILMEKLQLHPIVPLQETKKIQIEERLKKLGYYKT